MLFLKSGRGEYTELPLGSRGAGLRETGPRARPRASSLGFAQIVVSSGCLTATRQRAFKIGTSADDCTLTQKFVFLGLPERPTVHLRGARSLRTVAE